MGFASKTINTGDKKCTIIQTPSKRESTVPYAGGEGRTYRHKNGWSRNATTSAMDFSGQRAASANASAQPVAMALIDELEWHECWYPVESVPKFAYLRPGVRP